MQGPQPVGVEGVLLFLPRVREVIAGGRTGRAGDPLDALIQAYANAISQSGDALLTVTDPDDLDFVLDELVEGPVLSDLLAAATRPEILAALNGIAARANLDTNDFVNDLRRIIGPGAASMSVDAVTYYRVAIEALAKADLAALGITDFELPTLSSMLMDPALPPFIASCIHRSARGDLAFLSLLAALIRGVPLEAFFAAALVDRWRTGAAYKLLLFAHAGLDVPESLVGPSVIKSIEERVQASARVQAALPELAARAIDAGATIFPVLRDLDEGGLPQ